MLRKKLKKQKNDNKFTLDDFNFREQTHKIFKTTVFGAQTGRLKNTAAGVLTLFKILISIILGKYPGVRFLIIWEFYSYVWGNIILNSIVALSFCISTNSVQGSQFLHILQKHLLSFIFFLIAALICMK